MKLKMTTAVCGAALLVQVSTAAAAPRPADAFVGSDTWDAIMKNLFEVQHITGPTGGGVNNGIGVTAAQYLGLGSTTGQRSMEGATVAGTDQVDCGDGTASHPGCQEIAPMSRQMDSAICDDAESTFAEGIQVCDDGLAVYTDNSSLKADDATACTSWKASSYAQSHNATGDSFVGTVGQLGVSRAGANGYQIGGNGMPAWKDVLRLVYTGCKNTDGTCATAIDRRTRCGDAVRAEVISNWMANQAGSDCNSGNTCSGGLRRAYRRDDSSGTTGVFLGFLGVDNNTATNLTARNSVTTAALGCTLNPSACCGNGSIPINPIPAKFAFCDGGQYENFRPDCQNGTFIPVGGDPIKKPCAPEDDLCDFNGDGGVVQAIVSTPAEADAFATHQCGNADFKLVSVYASSQNTCPDGTKPIGDLCYAPVFNPSSPIHNCMVSSQSHSGIVSGIDGRSYNTIRRRANGTVVLANSNDPVTPSWRMNSIIPDTTPDLIGGHLNSGKALTSADTVCTRENATEQVGCIVGKTTCTIGYSGREAVYSLADATLSNFDEPFKLPNAAATTIVPPNDSAIAAGNYVLARALYMNAIGGFENVSADCAARGEDAAWCSDELNIAKAAYDDTAGGGIPNGALSNACIAAGYIPRIPANRACVGAQGNAGCGQPTNQARSACQPL